jgi:Fic family protein
MPLNERQSAMLSRLLYDFTGKLTTSKWAKMMKVSQDTAARDITDLITKGILQKEPGGGRSSAYTLTEQK